MLWAVHISDGVLAWPWLVGGFALAGLLFWAGSWQMRDDEVPRIAILTSAFFVASLIHIKVPPTSIHLLLGGLVGVVLGPRAALVIFVGLLLQVVLFQHGGYATLGVNTCVMTFPALFCFGLYRLLHQIPWIHSPVSRSLLVGIAGFIWFLSGIYSVTLLCNTSFVKLEEVALSLANARLVDPRICGGATLFAILAVILERRLENRPEFALGFLIGEISVLLTVALNCAVLLVGGEELSTLMILGLMIAHLPFAVIEGVILGFAVGFLAKVKPEMLGIGPTTNFHGGHGDRQGHPSRARSAAE